MSTLKTNNIQHVDRSDPSIIINTDGSVNIAGTMTYEDVTNVDAVGIITGRELINAQKQVHVGTGVSVKAGGLNVTAGITTVQALQATTGTFSSNVSIAGITTFGDDVTFTGASANIIFDKSNNHIQVFDNASINFGSSGDLKIHHTGNVNIIDDVQSKNISIQRGGSEQWKFGDGTFIGSDNKKIQLGNAQDLQIYHDGSNSFIKDTGTGGLFIQGSGGGAGITLEDPDGNDFIKCIDEGTGGTVELYKAGVKKFETTSSGGTLSGSLLLDAANAEINLKAGVSSNSGAINWTFNTADTNYAYISLPYDTRASLGFNIHSGYPITFTGGNSNHTLAKLNLGGSVELYHNNTKMLETTADGATLQKGLTVRGIEGGEAQIRIEADEADNASDRFRLVATDSAGFFIQSYDGSQYDNLFGGFLNGAAKLYHNNSEKLATTSTGIKVEGDNLELYRYRSYNSDAATYQKIGTNNSAVDNNKVYQWRFGITGNAFSGSSFVFSNLRNQQNSYTEELRLHPDGGISFNGDTASANALDDYEEGDHTTVVTMTGDTSFSYSARTLSYTKIGRVVHVTGRIIITGAGGSDFQFTLPFTSGNNFKFETSNEFQNIRFDDSYTFRISPNTAVARMQNSTGGSPGMNVSDPHLNVNLTYFV